MSSNVAPPIEIATLRIELMDSDPLIWREAEVPTTITLATLHAVIQAAMGWLDYHHWEFTIAERRYELPDDGGWGTEPRQDASKVQLREVLQPGNRQDRIRTTNIIYIYDFGDNWCHQLTVRDVRCAEPGVSYPRYIAGERNAPPEDCGGISGFYEMLDALADQNHPDHAEIVEWLDEYAPETIDEPEIKRRLASLAKQRSDKKTKKTKPES